MLLPKPFNERYKIYTNRIKNCIIYSYFILLGIVIILAYIKLKIIANNIDNKVNNIKVELFDSFILLKEVLINMNEQCINSIKLINCTK
jgi:hypothetical protein